MFATICASGAVASLTPGTWWRDFVTLSACSSLPLVISTPVADRAADGVVGSCILRASKGVSERFRYDGVGSEGSLSLGLSRLVSRSTDCEIADRFCSDSAGDWLSSRATISSSD